MEILATPAIRSASGSNAASTAVHDDVGMRFERRVLGVNLPSRRIGHEACLQPEGGVYVFRSIDPTIVSAQTASGHQWRDLARPKSCGVSACRDLGRGSKREDEMEGLWLILKEKAFGLLDRLSPVDLYNIWLASGVVMFLVIGWWSIGRMRRAFGHHKFRGTWFSETAWSTMIKMIDEDCQKGNRVMRADEMAALRKWRFGDTKVISSGKSGYF